MTSFNRFERLIAHLHVLSECPEVKVSTNVRVSDPDNPGQSREIDVVIQRDGLTTYVECRLRKGKQDVKWIEELIGRRTSLRVDRVLGVSASGFTEGAIRKARAYGIAIRDLRTLSRSEVLKWGKRSAISIKWLHMEPLSICLLLNPEEAYRVTYHQVFAALRSPDTLYAILERIKHALPEDRLIIGETVSFHDFINVEVAAGSCLIRRAEVMLTSWLSEELVDFVSVRAYGDAIQHLDERDVQLGDAPRLGITLGRAADNFSILFQQRMQEPPTNAMLYRLSLSFDHPVVFKCITSLNKGEILPDLRLDSLQLFARMDDDLLLLDRLGDSGYELVNYSRPTNI